MEEKTADLQILYRSPPAMGTVPPFGLHCLLARCLPTNREFSSRHGLVVDFCRGRAWHARPAPRRRPRVQVLPRSGCARIMSTWANNSQLTASSILVTKMTRYEESSVYQQRCRSFLCKENHFSHLCHLSLPDLLTPHRGSLRSCPQARDSRSIIASSAVLDNQIELFYILQTTLKLMISIICSKSLGRRNSGHRPQGAPREAGQESWSFVVTRYASRFRRQ